MCPSQYSRFSLSARSMGTKTTNLNSLLLNNVWLHSPLCPGKPNLTLSAPHGAGRDGVAADAALGEQVHAEAWRTSPCHSMTQQTTLHSSTKSTREQEQIGVSSGRTS